VTPAPSPFSPAAARRLGAIAIAVLAIIAYAPAIGGGGFIWDDDDYVTRNVHLRDAAGLARIWQPGTTRQYYPLVFTTFWVEHRLWGLDPAGYHAVNVLLHATCALLLWASLARLRIPGAWLAGAIFALHPLHVESVAWITERKNVLSGVLYFASALAYWRFDPSAAGDPDGRRRWAWYAAALILFVLSLLAKTVTCSLPAAIILLMVLRGAPITPARLAPLLPFFAAGLILALHTAHLERESVGAVGAAFDRPLLDRALVAARALVFYPAKLLVPWPLIFIYPRWTIDPASIGAWWPVAVVIAAAAAAIILFARGRREPAVALAFSAGTISPALGFIDVFPHQFSFVADHFAYLASAGIIALVAAALAAIAAGTGRPRIASLAATIVLAPLGALTWVRCGIYTSAESVWRDTIRRNDSAWIAHNNLSAILLRRAGAAMDADGADEARALAAEALGHADRAIALRSDYNLALGNRAEALRLLGRLDEAVAAQEQAIAIVLARTGGAAPAALAGDYAQLARLEERRGRFADAEAAYARALAIGGDDAGVLAGRARCLIRLERFAEAAATEEQVLAIRPDDFTALATLASLLERLERYDRVAALFRAALAAAPRPIDAVQVTTRLIRFLAHCPDPAHRDVGQAVLLAEGLADATGSRDPAALDVLASVYAEAGRRDDAIATAERALDLARGRGADDLAAAIEARLAGYRSRAAPSPAPPR
jgi:tetratricopeptide (TPR) repeat protein